MSPSWIDRLRSIGRAKKAVGLYIGRRHVAITELSGCGGRWRLQSSADATLEIPLFLGMPSSESITALANALKPFAAGLATQYVPLHVSLADPAIRVAFLHPQALPAKRQQQMDFARWRLAEDFGIASAACDCQPLGSDGRSPLLLAMAMEERWLQGVRTALASLGLVPWTLTPLSARLFNLFHDSLVAESGALVVLAPESWALWLWDAQGRPRHVASGWRETDEVGVRLVDQIQRTVLAYVHSPVGAPVSKMFLVSGAGDVAVEEALASRLRGVCIKLDPELGISLPDTETPCTALRGLSAAGVIAA